MHRRLTLSLALALMIPVSIGAQDPQDVGHGGTPGPGPGNPSLITETGGMTVLNVVMDFDLMAAGPTTVGAIQAAFPGSALANITLTPRTGTGNYDSQDGGGRALGGNADGSGNLALIEAGGGAFGNIDSMTVDLIGLVTEFGFELGDWAGPFNVEIFDGMTSVGTFQFSTVGDARLHFFSSDMPFNRVVFSALPDSPAANWVMPALHVPSATAVPSIPPVALVLLVMALLGGATLWLRRRQAFGTA